MWWYFFYPEKKSFILRKLHIWASGVTAAAGDVLLSLQSWPLLNTQQVHHIIFYWSYTGKKNWSLCLLCDGFLLLWLLNVSRNRGEEKKRNNTRSLIEGLTRKPDIYCCQQSSTEQSFPSQRQQRLAARAGVRSVTWQATVPAATEAGWSTAARLRSFADLIPERRG